MTPAPPQVAFLRNVNQGQRGHPATTDLITAFVDAGARDVIAFQSNGTVLFTVSSASPSADEAPSVLIADASALLTARGVFAGQIFTRPLRFVEDVVDRHADAASAHRRELTLFAPGDEITDLAAAAQVAAHRRCTIIEHGRGWAVIENERDQESNGTGVVERLLGTPASSRGLPTLVRLVDRFSR